MTKAIELISLPGWDDPTVQELSDITLDAVNAQSVMLAESVATYTLDGMASSNEALMEAAVPLVEGYLGHITCYLTPVEISAAKAAETQ